MTSTDLSSVSRNSSAASNDMFRGRKKKNQLRPLNVNDSGFVSDGTPSSCGSMRPVETPFTPVARKISALSLRSIIVSDDSGCSSYYRESDSCLSRSASSCSLSSGKNNKYWLSGRLLLNTCDCDQYYCHFNQHVISVITIVIVIVIAIVIVIVNAWLW